MQKLLSVLEGEGKIKEGEYRKKGIRSQGSGYRRKEEVKIFKGMPYEEWTREKSYGNRWPITEGIFSGSKRVFGEYVSATKKRNMYHEVKLKFWAYNLLQGIT